MLLVDQDVQTALDVSQRAYVVDNGRIVKESESELLKNDPEIRRPTWIVAGGYFTKRKKEESDEKSWLLLICLALVLGLSTSPAMAQDVIKMGASVSLTGAQSRFGNMVKTGYEMWKDYVNDAGGINVGGKKYKVAVVFYDDQFRPDGQRQADGKADHRRQSHVLLGPYSSGITFATSGIAEKYNMINMSVLANADNLYTRGYKNIFSVLPPASALTTSFLEMVADDEAGAQEVRDHQPHRPVPAERRRRHPEIHQGHGMEVVAYEKVAKGVKDIASPLLKIKQMKADVLIGTGYLDDGILAVRQSKDLKIDFRAMFLHHGPRAAGLYEEPRQGWRLRLRGLLVDEGDELQLPGLRLDEKIRGLYSKKIQHDGHSLSGRRGEPGRGPSAAGHRKGQKPGHGQGPRSHARL